MILRDRPAPIPAPDSAGPPPGYHSRDARCAASSNQGRCPAARACLFQGAHPKTGHCAHSSLAWRRRAVHYWCSLLLPSPPPPVAGWGRFRLVGSLLLGSSLVVGIPLLPSCWHSELDARPAKTQQRDAYAGIRCTWCLGAAGQVQGMCSTCLRQNRGLESGASRALRTSGGTQRRLSRWQRATPSRNSPPVKTRTPVNRTEHALASSRPSHAGQAFDQLNELLRLLS